MKVSVMRDNREEIKLIANRLIHWRPQQSRGPWCLLAIPTFRCNVECGVCFRNWYPIPPFLFDELTDDRWLRLVDEAKDMGVRFFVIGGGGEPMLRGKLVTAMCVKTKRLGMEGRLQTNGTRMPPETMEALITSGWDCLSISLDGPDESVNDAVRFQGSFRKVEATLRELKEMKAKFQSVYPSVCINMTFTSQNYNRLEDMVEFCADSGVALLSVNTLIESSEADTRYPLNQKQREELPVHVQNAVTKADALGLTHNLNNLLFLPEASKNSMLPKNPGSSEFSLTLAGAHCLEPWTGVSIVSSGQISPCCFFWDEHAESIQDMTLAEAWNGPYMTAFRKHMLEGNFRGECVTCSFPHSKDYQLLKETLKDTAHVAARIGLRGLAHKFSSNLRKHGVYGSYQRFKEWRAIRRALHNESK
jgi:MoaA/NifB/PqqE/SkfB family radical SAM enzyme